MYIYIYICVYIKLLSSVCVCLHSRVTSCIL